MTHPVNEPPLNPLPPVVAAFALVLAGIEIVLSLAARGMIGGASGIGWRNEAITRYAFSDRVFEWMLQTGQWPVEHVLRFVSYPFIHLSFTHAVFGVVIFLALGKLVTEVMGTARMLIIFFVSGICAAVAFGLFLDNGFPLVGAMPGGYGLIGGFTYLTWLRLGQVGERQIMAFRMIGILMALQLFFGAISDAGAYAWLPDLVGFAAGFVLSVVMSPGMLARFRGR